MKYIPSAMKFGNQSRSGLLMINMKLEIADLDPKLKTWFGLKITMCPIIMEFGTKNKSSMLIINIVTVSDDLDPKLQICQIWSQN